jgi:hypothetical protein
MEAAEGLRRREQALKAVRRSIEGSGGQEGRKKALEAASSGEVGFAENAVWERRKSVGEKLDGGRYCLRNELMKRSFSTNGMFPI